jgi:hypothetical protein
VLGTWDEEVALVGRGPRSGVDVGDFFPIGELGLLPYGEVCGVLGILQKDKGGSVSPARRFGADLELERSDRREVGGGITELHCSYKHCTSGCGKYGKVALTDLLVRVTDLAETCF